MSPQRDFWFTQEMVTNRKHYGLFENTFCVAYTRAQGRTSKRHWKTVRDRFDGMFKEGNFMDRRRKRKKAFQVRHKE